MKLEHHTEQGIDVVQVSGHLVMAAAADARSKLKELINGGSGKLIIDLKLAEFVDSSGLSVLVSSLQAARKKAGDVYLVGPSKDVRALLELTRLHTVFQIFDDEAEAVRAFT
jgi:anti-sigma B factor antagonist